MLITLGILLIGTVIIGHTVETNFKKFKWFINEPTIFMIRSLTGDRLSRLNYFDFILFDQYKKLILDRWENDFGSRIYSERPKNQYLTPFKVNTDMEPIPFVESLDNIVTQEDRKEMELRSEFIRKSGTGANPVERDGEGNIINHFKIWKESRNSKENLS